MKGDFQRQEAEENEKQYNNSAIFTDKKPYIVSIINNTCTWNFLQECFLNVISTEKNEQWSEAMGKLFAFTGGVTKQV